MKIAVFTDHDDNRLIIPGIWYDPDDPDRDSYKATSDAIMYGIILNLKHVWQDFEMKDGVIQIKYVETIAAHSAFVHGGATVYLISGPQFDSTQESNESIDRA